MGEELKPCPFCNGESKRMTLGEDDGDNAGGDVIFCTRCQASSHVEFGRKENLVARWNTRTQSTRIAELEEALRPFAKAGEVKLCGEWRDDEHFGRTDVQFYLTLGDFRRASSVLSKGED